MRSSLVAALLALAVPVGSSHAASPVVYDANSLPLGIWIQNQGGSNQTLLSSKGYCFAISTPSGEFVPPACFLSYGGQPSALHYESADCSGTSYIAGVSDFARGGWVAPGPSFGPLRYVPRGAVPAMRTFLSRRDGGGACVSDGSSSFSMPLLLNDAAITGVAAPLALPLEIRFEERCVFADGFDCPA